MGTLAAFVDELEKIAVTRSVKEWRRAQGAGDIAGANQIAQASGQLGLAPRYLQDISMGGAEAGVDRMMGRVQGPTGETNPSGYVARKLYKPDSDIHRAEFTPQVLEQKQRFTDIARSISPEAKQMVPAMYGHKTMGEGTPLQRSVSYHEYIPNISDIRGTNLSSPGAPPLYSRPPVERSMDIEAVRQNVLNPMHAQGKTIADVVGAEGGGVNYGNIVRTAEGPKVLDFLPKEKGVSPMGESFMKYAPTGSKFREATEKKPLKPGQTASVPELRKEVFNPQMQISQASPEMRRLAFERYKRLEEHNTSAMPESMSAASVAGPPPVPAGPVKTIPSTPQAIRAARPATAPPAMESMGTHAAWFRQPPRQMPRITPPAPGMMTRAGNFARGLIGRAR